MPVLSLGVSFRLKRRFALIESSLFFFVRGKPLSTHLTIHSHHSSIVLKTQECCTLLSSILYGTTDISSQIATRQPSTQAKPLPSLTATLPAPVTLPKHAAPGTG